jgi:hypothetical protein
MKDKTNILAIKEKKQEKKKDFKYLLLFADPRFLTTALGVFANQKKERTFAMGTSFRLCSGFRLAARDLAFLFLIIP